TDILFTQRPRHDRKNQEYSRRTPGLCPLGVDFGCPFPSRCLLFAHTVQHLPQNRTAPREGDWTPQPSGPGSNAGRDFSSPSHHRAVTMRALVFLPTPGALLPMSRLTAVLLLSLLTSPLFAEDWPSWRGPRGDGTSFEKGIPARWTTSE